VALAAVLRGFVDEGLDGFPVAFLLKQRVDARIGASDNPPTSVEQELLGSGANLDKKAVLVGRDFDGFSNASNPSHTATFPAIVSASGRERINRLPLNTWISDPFLAGHSERARMSFDDTQLAA
jgi:hypothetical protein